MESKIFDQVKSQLIDSGWGLEDILEKESFSLNDITYRSDIILTHKLNSIALIEIKNTMHAPLTGVKQLMIYLEILKLPIGFVTNGESIFQVLSINRQVEQIEKFPSPDILWQVVFPDSDENDPRSIPPLELHKRKPKLFQLQAINQTISAIRKGENRLHIQMAKGTGKTVIAFELCWKLLKSNFFKKAIFLSDHEEQTKFLMKQLSQYDWKVEKISTNIQSQDNNVFILSISEISEIANIEYLMTLDTVIFIDAENFTTRWDKFASKFINESIQATQILFTSREIPWELVKQFGQPIYQYSDEQIFINDLFRVPEGFETQKLDDISEISMGYHSNIIEDKEIELQNSIFVYRAKDLVEIDKLDSEHLSNNLKRIEKTSIDEKWFLRPNDILISSMPIRGFFPVLMFSNTNNNPVTYSSSVIRIRLDPKLAKPIDVYEYLKSDSGQSAIKLLTTQIGTSLQRINIRALAQLPILFTKNKKQISPTSQVISQIQNNIIPSLKKVEKQVEDTSDLNSIANQLRHIASLLAPSPLPERILQSFPSPIALAYRKYKDSRFNVYEQVLRLRDVFEATSFYVYNIVLADVLYRLDPKTYFIKDKGARRAYNYYSMASRLDFITSIIDIAKNNDPNDLFIPEIINTKFVEKAKELQENFRNRLSHSATATESQQQKVLDEFRPVVMGILEELEFLTQYRLVRIPAFYFNNGQWYRRTEIYHGVVPEIDEQPVSIENGLTPADKNHLVLLDGDDQILSLYPLYQLLSSEETRNETHLCFFKQRKKAMLLLEGESVQGAFELKLKGYEEFENLQNRILETL
jgi:type I restriction enzyme R subunit